MSYFVTLTFDLSDAEADDYENVKSELTKNGLYDTATGNSGKQIELPFNTYCGQFEESNNTSESLRNYFTDKESQVFNTCKVKGNLFVSVGNGWSWGQRQV
ncbi:hypothetical protein ACHOLT_17265 [Desulfitobacterium sp. Sab5]|uniref:hypothetical protein n=1 Tax=Desulfitobacterium nosdiversum TaxID=3375356 RepID=UPI003CF281A0